MGDRASEESGSVRRAVADWAMLAGALALGAGLLAAGRILTAGEGARRSYDTLTDLPALAGLAAVVLGLALLAWLAFGAVLALAAAVLLRLGSRRAAGAAARLAPGFLRRLAAAVAGVQILAAASAGALAADPGGEHAQPPAGFHREAGATGPQPGPDPSPVPVPESVREPAGASPLWRPARPVDAPGLLGRGQPAAAGQAAGHDTVAVRAGDSLWSLTAAHLGPLAGDAEIAREWPRWYALNRDDIGPDPNRLYPGQVLLIPPPP